MSKPLADRGRDLVERLRREDQWVMKPMTLDEDDEDVLRLIVKIFQYHPALPAPNEAPLDDA